MKRSDTYVDTPRVSLKSRIEKAGKAVSICVLVLLGLVFMYGALLALSSPRALLDPKDADLVRLIPTRATVENIEYPREGFFECSPSRHTVRNVKLDVTFRFVSNDGKFIKVRKIMCRRDIPGWGAPVFNRTKLHEGEEILLWYDPVDPSKISWPRRYSPRQMFTGLTLMGAVVVVVVLVAGFAWALHLARPLIRRLTGRLKGARWLVHLRAFLRPITHRRVRLSFYSDDGYVDCHSDLAALLPMVKDDLVARQKFLDILQTMDPADPRTVEYRRKFTAQIFK